MAIVSYSDLVDSIVDWMNDASLADKAPLFIHMAEAMFNRRLFNLEAEGAANIAADAEIPLTTDFAALKTVWLATDSRPLLQPMPPDDTISSRRSAAPCLRQQQAFPRVDFT